MFKNIFIKYTLYLKHIHRLRCTACSCPAIQRMHPPLTEPTVHLILWPMSYLTNQWTDPSPTWLTNVSDVASRRHLRSAGRRLLNVPHQRRSTFVRRAFSVAGPLVWNSLPDYLRDPAVSRVTFCKHLKTFLFAVYWYTFSALELIRRCVI